MAGEPKLPRPDRAAGRLVTVRIYLIRHGESLGNVGGILTGQSDLPLSARGREQAGRVGEALAGRRLTAIFASPLSRALDTARPVSEATGATIQPVDDLRELNCGLAEGLTWLEVEERWPAFAQRYTAADAGMALAWPGGESGVDLCERVGRALHQIIDGPFDPDAAPNAASAHSREIAIVAHAGSIAWSLHHLLKKPLNTWPRYGLRNAGISELIVHDRDEPAELVRLNDVGHLDGGAESGM